MAAAGNIGVGQFIDEDHFWFSRKDGVHIHLFEDRAFILDLFSWNGFHLRGQLFDAFAAVGLYDADDYVFAAAPAAERFAQHAVRFADAGSVAEEKFEYAARFLRRRGDFQPVLWLLWQGSGSPFQTGCIR